MRRRDRGRGLGRGCWRSRSVASPGTRRRRSRASWPVGFWRRWDGWRFCSRRSRSGGCSRRSRCSRHGVCHVDFRQLSARATLGSCRRRSPGLCQKPVVWLSTLGAVVVVVVVVVGCVCGRGRGEGLLDCGRGVKVGCLRPAFGVFFPPGREGGEGRTRLCAGRRRFGGR